MTKNKIILGSVAALVTITSAFAFTNRTSKFGAGTLFTKVNNGGVCHAVDASRTDHQLGQTATSTFYTIGHSSCTGTKLISNGKAFKTAL